jgi:hypothetical protein
MACESTNSNSAYWGSNLIVTDRAWMILGAAVVLCLVIFMVVFDRVKKPSIREELIQRAVYVCEIRAGGYGYTPPSRLTPKQLAEPNQKHLYEKFQVIENEMSVLGCVNALVGGIK